MFVSLQENEIMVIFIDFVISVGHLDKNWGVGLVWIYFG